MDQSEKRLNEGGAGYPRNFRSPLARPRAFTAKAAEASECARSRFDCWWPAGRRGPVPSPRSKHPGDSEIARPPERCPGRRPSSTHGVIGINNAETSNEMFEQRTPPNA